MMSSHDSRIFENMDFNFNNYKEVLKVLQEENILFNKLQCMEHLVSNYLSTMSEDIIDSEIFYILMPQTKEVLEKIFEKTIELVYDSDKEEMCVQTLKTIQEYMQMVISLFEIVDEILNFIISKNKIASSDVKSLPVNIAQILYTTFLHCKESNNIYKIYFDQLSEILIVFKKAQEIHSKWLNVLENYLVFNVLDNNEIMLLIHVLDNVTEIGDVLSGMNVKSMADNWKSYMNLIQKYSNELNKYLNIQRPLLYFTSELTKSLNNVLEMDMDDNKSIIHTIKISSFLLKIMLRLCDLFWKKIPCHVDIFWTFFIDFYSLYSPAIKNKQFSDNTVNLLKSLLCNGLDQLLSKLVCLKEFYNMQLLDSLITNSDCPFGFLLVSNVVLQKLISEQNVDVTQIHFPEYLNVIFIALSKSYILFMKEDNLYEELLISIISLISVSNNDQFLNIEHLLCKNILTSHILNSLFAYDIWILICRTCNSNYAFEILCWIIESCDTVLKAHYTSSPQFVILSNFIAELFDLLDNSSKLQFLKKYSILTSLHIWKHVGLKSFPNSCKIQIDNFLSNTLDKIEKFDAGRCTYEEFLAMVDALNILESVPFEEMYFDLKKFNSLLQKLWDFDASNKHLLDSNIFKYYLEYLWKLTVKLSWRINNSQMIQVLQQLTLTCNNDTSLTPLLVIVRSILSRSDDFSVDQQMIFQNISEILVLLLTNLNSVIRVNGLELLHITSNNTTWNEVVQNLISRNPQLQKLISNFMNKNVTNDVNTFKTYLELEKVKFQHKCLENNSVEPVIKKAKIEVNLENIVSETLLKKNNTENIEASRLIQKIKKDIQHLGNLVGKDDLTEQNVKDINFILKELQNYEQ